MSEKSVEKSVMPGKNGGTLNRGGNTTPGTGRPKSEVRAACASAFDARIPKLQEIADNANGTYSSSDVLKALDMLGKYGGLQQTDVTSGDAPVKSVVIDASTLPTEQLDAILASE